MASERLSAERKARLVADCDTFGQWTQVLTTDLRGVLNELDAVTSERNEAQQLAAGRLSQYAELRVKCDALSRERDEANKWATRNEDHAVHSDGEVRRLTRERNEALARLEKFGYKEDAEEIRQSELIKLVAKDVERDVGLAGMNFITNRERGSK